MAARGGARTHVGGSTRCNSGTTPASAHHKSPAPGRAAGYKGKSTGHTRANHTGNNTGEPDRWATRTHRTSQERPNPNYNHNPNSRRVKPHTARARYVTTPGNKPREVRQGNRHSNPQGTRASSRRSSVYDRGGEDDDDDDEVGREDADSELPPRPATVNTAWAMFNQEICQIDDSSALLAFTSHGASIDKGASPQYISIIGDLRVRRQQQLEALKAKAESERLGSLSFDYSDDDEDGERKPEEEKISPLRMTALRAWAKIRREVQEIAMERRNRGAALNWSFLNQTIKRMTNMERGRQDLYDKYLKNPEEWKEGFVNKHLLKAIEKRRPKQEGTSPTHSRSSSPTPKAPKSKKSFNGR